MYCIKIVQWVLSSPALATAAKECMTPASAEHSDCWRGQSGPNAGWSTRVLPISLLSTAALIRLHRSIPLRMQPSACRDTVLFRPAASTRIPWLDSSWGACSSTLRNYRKLSKMTMPTFQCSRIFRRPGKWSSSRGVRQLGVRGLAIDNATTYN